MGIEQIVKNTKGTCVKQRTYNTGSLEQLSSTVLYTNKTGYNGRLLDDNYEGLCERVDASHGPIHVNYDLEKADRWWSNKQLGNNHRVDLVNGSNS